MKQPTKELLNSFNTGITELINEYITETHNVSLSNFLKAIRTPIIQDITDMINRFGTPDSEDEDDKDKDYTLRFDKVHSISTPDYYCPQASIKFDVIKADNQLCCVYLEADADIDLTDLTLDDLLKVYQLVLDKVENMKIERSASYVLSMDTIDSIKKRIELDPMVCYGKGAEDIVRNIIHESIQEHHYVNPLWYDHFNNNIYLQIYDQIDEIPLKVLHAAIFDN